MNSFVWSIAMNNERIRQSSPDVPMLSSIAMSNDTSAEYPGGKGNCYQRIINLIPPHETYIEPFVGGGAVFRNKKPAPGNIVIDSDAAAIDNLRSHIANYDDRARFTALVCDALKWLQSYDFSGKEFVYADPPYLMSTRRQHRHIYRYELASIEQHEKLLDILVSLPCKVMISGYWSELYAARLVTWHTETFMAVTRGGSMAQEWLWMNYQQPTRLHDYRYLGDDFRERERIKRKANRWAKNFKKLPILERRAIMAQLEEYI